MAWKFRKKAGPAGPEAQEERDGKLRTVAVGLGFVLLALAFMWASSLKDAYESSRASLEEAYARRIAAAAAPPVEIDMYAHMNLPEGASPEGDGVDLDRAVAEVARYQDDFMEIISGGAELIDANFEAYAETVQAAWDNMEKWFPNKYAHSWYQWDSDAVAAGWHGYNISDAQDRPMGIWLCLTPDNNLLAYAMAWYAGDHMYSSWSLGQTALGWKYLRVDKTEYKDPLEGKYEPAPGDGDMSDGRTLDDHVDSALAILDGLGMSHSWYDSIMEKNGGGDSDGGQEAAAEQGDGGAGAEAAGG